MLDTIFVSILEVAVNYDFPKAYKLVQHDILSGGYNHWTGLLDWTTGLDYWTHPTAKYNSFSTEQKLNFLISSVTSLTLLPTASFLEFLEVKGHVHI